MNRYHLSVGFHGARTRRVVIVALVGGLAAIVLGCPGYLLGMPLLAAVPAGLVLLGTVLAILFVVRQDAWLEGTRLTVRSLRTRSVDLAAARSVRIRQRRRREVGPVPGGSVFVEAPPVASLVVYGDRGLVWLRFVSAGTSQLPPEQLRTLADAVSTGGCPGAPEAVDWLRALADRQAQ